MKKLILVMIMACSLFLLGGCGQSSDNKDSSDGAAVSTAVSSDTDSSGSAESESPDWKNMSVTDSLELSYATKFTVDYYDNYKLFTVDGDQKFLLVPEDAGIPSNLDSDITVLKQPLDKIYLVSTSCMDYFKELDAIGNIALSGTKENDWYIDEAKEAMESGDLVYAGKYSTPDYELILSTGCDLAIENTMIYHTPEVEETLESLGIPVIVDHSSYENDPLARMEWVKFYAALLDKEDEAEKFYNDLLDQLKPVMEEEETDKTVAFFYITSTGAASVRKASDYVAKSIEIAGGKYTFADLDDDSATTTMNMQMEQFYEQAKDTDILIYNSTIDGELTSISQLLDKSSLLADFKAVKEGNVFCTDKNLFQQSLGLGDLILDIHAILEDPSVSDDALNYLHRLQ